MTDWQPGDTFVKGAHRRADDPMALYRFEGWNPAPASTIGGRLADATWLYNGSRSSSWERDMIPIGGTHEHL